MTESKNRNRCWDNPTATSANTPISPLMGTYGAAFCGPCSGFSIALLCRGQREGDGDVCQWRAIEPLLNVLLPATYRDLYTAGGGLRVDTGEPITTGTSEGFTLPLPGTAAGKPVVPAAEEDEERAQQDEEEEEGEE